MEDKYHSMGKYLTRFALFESKYMTYEDFVKHAARWGSPDDLKEDAIIFARHAIPGDWSSSQEKIKSVEDQSTSRGIKFEIELDSGDKIHLYKTGLSRGEWEIYVNGKRQRSQADAKRALASKEPGLSRYMELLKAYDSTWEFSDDSKVHRAGRKHADALEGIYSTLSSGDKRSAYRAFKSTFGTESSFSQFTGA